MYVYSQSVITDAQARDVLWHCYDSEKALIDSYNNEISDRDARRHAAWRVMTGAEVSGSGSYEDFAKAAAAYIDAHNACESAVKLRKAAEKRAESYYRRFSA